MHILVPSKRSRRVLDHTTRSQVPSPALSLGNYASGVRRIVFLTLASLFFALGMVGIVLPGLPTTPFLLLTSYFLARSSPRMHRALLENRYFGGVLRHWHVHRAVEPHVKLRAGALVVLSIVLVLCVAQLSVGLNVLVCCFASVGLLVIYRLPTSNR